MCLLLDGGRHCRGDRRVPDVAGLAHLVSALRHHGVVPVRAAQHDALRAQRHQAALLPALWCIRARLVQLSASCRSHRSPSAAVLAL